MAQPRFPDAPARIAALPVDHRGFPVPWFVAWIGGEPDFRVVDTPKFKVALDERRCWICGDELDRETMSFPIGPMCAINRTIAEPPSHLECCRFAAMHCPFLANPRAQRNTKAMPAHVPAAGEMIKRNPGVTCIWTTRTALLYPVQNGWLFELGDPVSVEWWAEGKAATRDQVVHSIETGLPIILEAVNRDPDPGAASDEFFRRLKAALRHVPEADRGPDLFNHAQGEHA